MPNAALFITTHSGATPISIAVATTLGFEPKALVTDERDRRRPFKARCDPDDAAAGPKPMVENPPGVRKESGHSTGYCCPTPFLFQPTSVEDRVRNRASHVRQDPFR